MPRRKDSSARAIVEVVALLPWWLGVLLALATYPLLHAIAGQPLQAAGAGLVRQALWQSLAAAGQYALPLLFLVGAVLSAVQRRRRSRLVEAAADGGACGVLDGMSWRDFEALVAEAFRREGYVASERGGNGADGGVDLVLRKPLQNGSEKYFVQCKHWRASRVGVDVVRQLYGVMVAHGAAGGILVTSGGFTAEAKQFADGRNVRLVDGLQLRQLLDGARSSRERAPGDNGPAAAPAPAATGAPACPTCAKPMVRRVAQRGARRGAAFWGCSGYPQCRGTRAIE